MRLLALDLGTKTGWALRSDSGEVTSGTKLLASPKELRQQKLAGLDRCCDMRPARLLEFIHGKYAEHIYFEDVQFLSTQLQSQLWASLRAMVTLQYPQAVVRAVPVGTLKKFATGHGNAKKEDMRAAWEMRTALDAGSKDDNEIDALHLLALARKELGI
jgi:hypothetical protein